MKISIITAMDTNRVIGNKNALPWHLPRELQYVKEVTMGHAIIMGRKNYESIGKALPGRRNIIVTRNTAYQAENCEVYHSVEEVLETCKQEEEIFIFGGEEIYKLFLPYVEKMYITKINHAFEGDTFFPLIEEEEWEEKSKEDGITDEKNPYEYAFYTYERKLKNHE